MPFGPFISALVIIGLATSSPTTGRSSKTATENSPTQQVVNETLVPAGFVKVEAAGRVAFCQPSDRPWVMRSFAAKIATSRPAVSIDDLAANLALHRGQLRSLLVEQLVIAKPDAADAFLDHQINDLIARVRTAHVRLVYLVLTHSALKTIVQNGWGGDQFHYNRVADKIVFDGEVTASLDGTVRDSLVPAIYQSDDSIDKRTTDLTANVQRTESGVAAMISREGQSAIESTIGEFVLREGLLPLKLDNNQDWFDAGVVGVVAASAMSEINGRSETEVITELTQPSRFNPVRMDSVDLLHPVARDQLRPQLVEAYADTFRKRSVKVVADWLADAGPDGLSKTIAAIRKDHPADNGALLAIIQQQTGIDLTVKLQPGG